MLQVELKTYASDALEDAMRLAQTKALNSYSWSDCLNYLNYTWSDIYNRIAMIDAGYYSTTVRLNTEMTRIPPFVKNSITVYGAQDPVGFNREVFRSSGMADLRARSTYHISGFDLYCPDATRRTVWLNFTPIAPMLFFPINNRDPKLYDPDDPPKPISVWNGQHHEAAIQRDDYFLHTLKVQPSRWDPTVDMYTLVHKNATIDDTIWLNIARDDMDIIYIDCDFPYIFVTYKHRLVANYYESGFFKDVRTSIEWNRYNPFDFTGRRSNVAYIRTRWNDKTGMGVIIRDYDDYDAKYYYDHRDDFFDAVLVTSGMLFKPVSQFGITHFWATQAFVGKQIAGYLITVNDIGKRFPNDPNQNLAPNEQILANWEGLPFNGRIMGEDAKIFRVKELGFTPDTLLVYPCPEMYRYLVARLADKFSAFNESNVMGVQKELVEAKYAFEAFCERDKSSFKRIVNVNSTYITDWL